MLVKTSGATILTLALVLAVLVVAPLALAYCHYCNYTNVTSPIMNRTQIRHGWRLEHMYNMSSINVTAIAHRELHEILHRIMNMTHRKIIVNVTQIINEVRNYTNVTVIFRHGLMCHMAKLFFRHAVVILNETARIVNATVHIVKSIVLCNHTCIMHHVLIILNESKLIAPILVISNGTFRCHNCTVVGHIVLANGSRAVIVNPNMTYSNITCIHCRYVLSRYMSRFVNATINSTYAWIGHGIINKLLHNVTIIVRVSTPRRNVTISIVTKWCRDNYTVVRVPICINHTCIYRYVTLFTCRPKIVINITGIGNVTVMHGYYDNHSKILYIVNSTEILLFREHPAPGVLAELIVNASRGNVSTIIIRNVSKPVAVGYVRIVLNATFPIRNVTVLPYVDPRYFPLCKMCWTYINTTRTVMIHVLHHSPAGVIVFESREQIQKLALPIFVMLAVTVLAIAVAIAVAVKLIREKERTVKRTLT